MSEPEAPEAPGNFSRRLYLFAFALQHEIVDFVEDRSTRAELERLPATMERWVNIQPRIRKLMSAEASVANRAKVKPVSDAQREVVDRYEQDPRFRRGFRELVDSGVGIVDIDTLVAGQRAVDVDYAARLAESFGPSPSFEKLCEICLSMDRERVPVEHMEVEPNVHVFTCRSPDVRFLGAWLKDQLSPDDLDLAEGGVPTLAVTSLFGFGAAPMIVFSVGGRLILSNGFHRAYALRTLGVTQVPAVVHTVNNIDLEMPPVISDVSTAYLVSAPRPPLVKDFFEPDYTVMLDYRKVLTVVTVKVEPEYRRVPI